jgi:hypothetical protein
MTHAAPFSAAVPDLAGVVARRKRAARLTLAAHLAFVLALGAFMIRTEGSSAPVDAGHAVSLAREQEIFLAIAAMVQLALTGWWARLAPLVRRARKAGARAEPSPEPQDYLVRMARRDSGETRTVIGVCVVLIVVLSWLPETG